MACSACPNTAKCAVNGGCAIFGSFLKSSYSGGDNGSNCVEAAHSLSGTTVALRDSKAPASRFNVPRGSFSALLGMVKREGTE